MQGLEWEEEEGGRYVILRPRGNIALYNSQALERRLNELVVRGDRSVLLNLKDVSYFDSRGMGLFLDMYKKFEDLSSHFCLVAIPPARLSHFKISGLLGVLKVFGTEPEALRDLGLD